MLANIVSNLNEIEIVIDNQRSIEELEIGSKWVHPNGNIYTIILFGNIDSSKEKYPITRKAFIPFII